jgi:hypothetical protein
MMARAVMRLALNQCFYPLLPKQQIFNQAQCVLLGFAVKRDGWLAVGGLNHASILFHGCFIFVKSCRNKSSPKSAVP